MGLSVAACEDTNLADQREAKVEEENGKRMANAAICFSVSACVCHRVWSFPLVLLSFGGNYQTWRQRSACTTTPSLTESPIYMHGFNTLKQKNVRKREERCASRMRISKNGGHCSPSLTCTPQSSEARWPRAELFFSIHRDLADDLSRPSSCP